MATTEKLACDVKDLGAAAKGKVRIEWADQWMPVLQLIRKRFANERRQEQANATARSDKCFGPGAGSKPAQGDQEQEGAPGRFQYAGAGRPAEFVAVSALCA